MAFLIVFIFVLVLILAILPDFLPGISRKVVDLAVQEDEKESALREQLKTLQKEIKSISMADEFALYAKTERKIIRLKEEISKYTKNKSEVFLKLKFGSNIIFHIFQVSCMLGLIWTFRSEPLLELPEAWVYPFGKMVAFPSGVSGGIGITTWFLVCRSVVRKGMQLVKST